MGNFQCASFPESKKTIEYLETYLSKQLKINKTSTLLQEIFQEYSKIKENWKNHEKKIEIFKISKNFKNLTNFIDCNSQKKNFFLWAKQIFNEKSKEDIETLLNKKLSFLEKTNKKLIKDLISNGPPSCIRVQTWLTIAQLNNIEEVNLNRQIYTSLLNEEIDPKTDMQIKKDLNRTFFFIEQDTDDNKSKLYNILKAYSVQDKEISYCQGMNFLAKFLLEVTNYNDEVSFHLFSYILSQIRGFFYEDFPLLGAYMFIFQKLFKKLYPKLKDHFDLLEIPQELWVSKWTQTLFTMNLPYDINCRIWDNIFVYGIQFIIPFVLGFISFHEKTLLSFQDSSDVILFFKEILNPQTLTEVKRDVAMSNSVQVDKVIEEAKTIYSNASISDMFDKCKEEYEKINNISLDKLTKIFNFNSLKNSNNSTTINEFSDTNDIQNSSIINPQNSHRSFDEFDTSILEADELTAYEQKHVRAKVSSHILNYYGNNLKE